jgi:hypothetical protein
MGENGTLDRLTPILLAELTFGHRRGKWTSAMVPAFVICNTFRSFLAFRLCPA